MSTIVVGVDGSASARAALRFAFEEARIRGARLRVVAAWHVPLTVYEGAYVPMDPSLGEELETNTREAVESALADAGDVAADVDFDTIVREGQAATVLLEEAEHADLLVLGSRGLGGFRGLLLGSVSQQCAHHASCPVVIVPHPREL
jgi:nucleotide-binding universal stress UspA family protein